MGIPFRLYVPMLSVHPGPRSAAARAQRSAGEAAIIPAAAPLIQARRDDPGIACSRYLPLATDERADVRSISMNCRMNGALSCHVRAVTRLPSRTIGLSTYLAPPCSQSSAHLATVVTVRPLITPAALTISMP